MVRRIMIFSCGSSNARIGSRIFRAYCITGGGAKPPARATFAKNPTSSRRHGLPLKSIWSVAASLRMLLWTGALTHSVSDASYWKRREFLSSFGVATAPSHSSDASKVSRAKQATRITRSSWSTATTTNLSTQPLIFRVSRIVFCVSQVLRTTLQSKISR